MSKRWEEVATSAAERFLLHGYAAVGLREIADALGIKAASLYYHCPGGKPELYARSLQHFLRAYQTRLEQAAEGAPLDRALGAMAERMIESPPVDLRRIVTADLPELGDDELGRQVSEAVHDALLKPFADAFARGVDEHRIRRDVSIDLLAASAVALVAGLGWLHTPASPTNPEVQASLALVRQAFALLLRGARPHGRR